MKTTVAEKLEELTRRNKKYLEIAKRLRESADSFVPMGCEIGPVVAFGEDPSGILSEIEAGFDQFDGELRKLGLPVELDNPPTEPGWYWCWDFDEHVIIPGWFSGPQKTNRRWWTCPIPEIFEACSFLTWLRSPLHKK